MRFSLLLILVFTAVEVGAQEVSDRTCEAADGSTVLVHALEVPAVIADVWAAFTTVDGLTSWAVPRARVDFRLGGIWESSYDPAAEAGASGNIRNRYLSFVPDRMIALQAVGAPPDFPHPEVLEDLFSVTEFHTLDENRTRVTMYGVGYHDTPAHHAVLEMVRDANAWSLRMLHRRFTDGPIDWSVVRQSQTKP